MTTHACPQCGHEARCSRAHWVDRHPTAAAATGLVTLTLMSMMLSEHTVAGLTVLAVAAVIVAVWAAGRERARRQAPGSRADHGHRALMAAAMPSLLAPRRPLSPTRYRVMRDFPADPLRPR